MTNKMWLVLLVVMAIGAAMAIAMAARKLWWRAAGLLLVSLGTPVMLVGAVARHSMTLFVTGIVLDALGFAVQGLGYWRTRRAT
jgi:hypothetical protein